MVLLTQARLKSTPMSKNSPVVSLSSTCNPISLTHVDWVNIVVCGKSLGFSLPHVLFLEDQWVEMSCIVEQTMNKHCLCNQHMVFF